MERLEGELAALDRAYRAYESDPRGEPFRPVPTGLLMIEGDKVGVRVKFRGAAALRKAWLEAMGATNVLVDDGLGIAEAMVPIGRLADLAAADDVAGLSPLAPPLYR